MIIGFEKGKDIHRDLPVLYKYFDHIDCTETKIHNSMPAQTLLNLYCPPNKKINFSTNPLHLIRQRNDALATQDILVILGSHYFGPYLAKIYKKCFDIKSK